MVYRDTYRLNEASTVGNQFAGVLLDANFDSNFVSATLLRLDHGQMPEQWWAPRAITQLRHNAASSSAGTPV